jgi:hypothetical protein
MEIDTLRELVLRRPFEPFVINLSMHGLIDDIGLTRDGFIDLL